MRKAKLILGLRSAFSLAAHAANLGSSIPNRKGVTRRRNLAQGGLLSPTIKTLPLANVAITPMGDSLTSAMSYDGAALNRGTASVHNWALSRYGQPWTYTGFFGVSGETTINMLARLQVALDSTRAAVAAGKRTYFSDWSGTNDVGTLADSAATIFARKVTMWREAHKAGARPLIWIVTGSELFTVSMAQRLIDLNAMQRAWVATHAGHPLKPIICDIASLMLYRPIDLTMTDNLVCLSQAVVANVPMNLNGAIGAGGVAAFAQGTKLLFTHSDTTKTITVNGTAPDGSAITENVTLTSGVALQSSKRIYASVTSITSPVNFTNTLKVGGCVINQKEGYPTDGLHPGVIGAWNGAPAMWNAITSDCIPIPLLRTGTNLLPNVTFATLTGGTLGSNTTCSSGATPPLNWRTNNSSATAITVCDYFFHQNEGFVDINMTTAASASLANAFLRYDPPPASFVVGKSYDLWMRVFIPAGGAQSLTDVSVELSMNYASGTKSYYADRSSSVNVSTIPSTDDQWLTFRFSSVPVDASSVLNTVNFFVRAHATGAGVNKLKVGDFGLMELPS